MAWEVVPLCCIFPFGKPIKMSKVYLIPISLTAQPASLGNHTALCRGDASQPQMQSTLHFFTRESIRYEKLTTFLGQFLKLCRERIPVQSPSSGPSLETLRFFDPLACRPVWE